MPKIAIEITATTGELAEIISALSVNRTLEITVNPQRPVARSSLKPQKRETKKMSKNRPGRGRNWTNKEIAWLTAYALKNAVSKKVIILFKREFGYRRSYSSLANKAYECRKRNQ